MPDRLSMQDPRRQQLAKMAAVYALLASQEASFITGEVYAATGGAGVA